MELQWVEAGELRAPVLVDGSPAAPPAVLVPGLSDGLAPVTLPDTRALLRARADTAAACGHDAVDRLASARCPVLVLAGEHDPLCPPARGRQLATAITGADFEVFDGLAHGFPEQADSRFARRVLDFLAANERPGTAPDTST